MNDSAPLMAAYAELRTLLHNPSVPERVLSACLSLSQHQTKLFVTVPEGGAATDGAELAGLPGAPNLDVWGLRLEPSNFLGELIAAIRAAEWPRVLVLIHDAISAPLISDVSASVSPMNKFPLPESTG
jgi:hypothetical protein